MNRPEITRQDKVANRFRFWLTPLTIGIGLLGLALTYSIFAVVNGNYQTRLKYDFESGVDRRVAKLDQALNRSAEKLASVDAFFLSSESVDRQEFRSFTSGYLGDDAGFSLFAWAPVEESGNVSADTDARELAGKSYPMKFIEPGPMKEWTIAKDLMAISGMAVTVQNALLSGEVEYLSNNSSIILVQPTVKNELLTGVAIAVLPIDAIRMWIQQGDLGDSITIVEERNGHVIVQSARTADAPGVYTNSLHLGTETWRVTATPMPNRKIPNSAWATLAAGVVITALLLILILALAGNAERARKTVQLRTRELEQAEAEARAHAIRLANQVAHSSQVIFAIPSVFISLDINRLITQWNFSTQKLSGISSQDAVGRSLADCGWAGDIPALLDGVSGCLKENESVRLDNLIFTHDNGSDVTIGATIVPIRDSQENLDGCLIIGADVTDKNKLEVQLRESQRLEAVGRLAAGIAHEVNTPAQFVSDNTSFLTEAFDDLIELEAAYNSVLAELDSTLTDEQKQRIATAQSNADRDFLLDEAPKALAQSMDGIRRIADIVRAMKEFSHPGGGGGKEQVDFNRLINNAITVAANEWKYHAEVVTELDETLPALHCFPRELNQVVLNLLINAAHAISDRVGKSGERGKVTISTSYDENFITLRLTDTGTGIPEEVQGKIFEPFFTTKEVGRGSGQGLALAYSAVVEQHGGQLTFETEQGVGTTFIVNLPLQKQDVRSEVAA